MNGPIPYNRSDQPDETVLTFWPLTTEEADLITRLAHGLFRMGGGVQFDQEVDHDPAWAQAADGRACYVPTLNRLTARLHIRKGAGEPLVQTLALLQQVGLVRTVALLEAGAGQREERHETGTTNP